MLGSIFAALPGLASAAGGLFSMLGNKHRSEAPMNAANQYLDQIPGTAKPYYQPYINSGQNALNVLQGQYGNLLNNPGEMYNKFSEGYKQSPGYKNRLEEAMQAITNSQAAGGMAGSLQHQQLAANKAVDMSSEDFEQYLNHILGLYGSGLQGTQGMEEQGYGASTDFAHLLSNILGQKAQMSYEGKNAENTGFGQGLGNIFGGLGAAGSGYNSYNNSQDILRLLSNVGGR